MLGQQGVKMNKRFDLYRSTASVVAVFLVASTAQAQAQTAAQAQSTPQSNKQSQAGQPAESGEIVVTASKRDQKLRDVPSAITVLSGATLDTQGVTTVRDYATLTPGLGQSDQGRPGVGTIFIRGLTTGAGQQSATSVVYLGDVAFTSSSPESGSSYVAPNPELADIDHIEVLKGPQGTLYGASSLGGVVRIITKSPDPTAFSGNAHVEGTAIDGGGTGYAGRGVVNIPLLTDQLAVRATGFYRRDPGYVDNVGTGTNNVNDSISKGGRVDLGWTPTSKLYVDLIGSIEDTDTNGIAYQDDMPGTLTPVYGLRKYSQFFNAQSRIKHRLASAKVDYETGIGKIIATASFLDSRTHFETDETNVYAPYIPLFGYAIGTGLPLAQDIDLRKETTEIRFVSNRLGPIEFVAGLFQTHEHTNAPTIVTAVNMADRSQVSGLAGTFISASTLDRYNEYAGFGNLTVYLADRLDLTGGLRYTHNNENNSITYGGLLEGAPSLPAQVSSFSDNVVTYLATLRWRPTNTFSTFLRAASGYRPGGPQTNPTPPPGAETRILPDTVWNYEAGFKGDFLDHMLNVEASGFHIDWKNVQLNSTYDGLVLLANAAKAQVDGAELQLTVRPSHFLSMSANGAYTNARITSISPEASASVGAVKGDPMPLTPKWTASGVVDGTVPLSQGLDGQLGATLRFQSSMFNSYSENATDVNVKLPGITTVDLRAGLHFQRYRFQLRVDNVFNRNAASNYLTAQLFAGQGVPSQATIIRPRSFTLGLSVDF